MIETISVALSSLNAAKDLVQAIDGMKTAGAVLEVKLDLQRHLLSAYDAIASSQQQLTALEAERRQLEEKIMQFEDWSAEAKQYELADAGKRCLAYRKKPGMEGAEPPHWLCPNCWQERVKSLLQPLYIPNGRAEALTCPRCSLKLIVKGVDLSAPVIPSTARRGR